MKAKHTPFFTTQHTIVTKRAWFWYGASHTVESC